MSYQPEERYWTDYLRIAFPVLGLLLLLVNPPFTGLTRAGYYLLAASAVSTLPAWASTELLLPALPITERALIALPGGNDDHAARS